MQATWNLLTGLLLQINQKTQKGKRIMESYAQGLFTSKNY